MLPYPGIVYYVLFISVYACPSHFYFIVAGAIKIFSFKHNVVQDSVMIFHYPCLKADMILVGHRPSRAISNAWLDEFVRNYMEMSAGKFH